MNKYKPIKDVQYHGLLFFLDVFLIMSNLWLFKYLKLSNYIVFKIIICCICIIFSIKYGKKFLNLYILKDGLLLSYFSGIALGVMILPYNNPMSFGCCTIVYGFYIIVKMKNFNIDYYADKYDSRDSKLYILAKLKKSILLKFEGPVLIFMGILVFVFGIKEIIGVIL